jgi:hypothetical protein
MPFLNVEPLRDTDQIHERNGIWVVTINGVWYGDYTKREYAVAALDAAQLGFRPNSRP